MLFVLVYRGPIARLFWTPLEETEVRAAIRMIRSPQAGGRPGHFSTVRSAIVPWVERSLLKLFFLRIPQLFLRFQSLCVFPLFLFDLLCQRNIQVVT